MNNLVSASCADHMATGIYLLSHWKVMPSRKARAQMRTHQLSLVSPSQ